MLKEEVFNRAAHDFGGLARTEEGATGRRVPDKGAFDAAEDGRALVQGRG